MDALLQRVNNNDLIPFETGLCANTTFQPHSKHINDRNKTKNPHPKHIQKGNPSGKFEESLRAA